MAKSFFSIIDGLSDEEIFIAPEDYLDWEVAASKVEDDIRPQERGIIQIQVDAIDAYSVFLYPDTIREFDDPDALCKFLLPIVRDEQLLNLGFALASNYRLANIDLNERVAYRVHGYHRL